MAKYNDSSLTTKSHEHFWTALKYRASETTKKTCKADVNCFSWYTSVWIQEYKNMQIRWKFNLCLNSTDGIKK